MSVSFLSIPKDVIINHIIPHLLCKERVRLHRTCKQLWALFKPDGYFIFDYYFERMCEDFDREMNKPQN